MKRSQGLVTSALVLLSLMPALAQTKPDFSGKWRYSSARSSRDTQGNTPDMTYPSDLTLKQTATELQFLGSAVRQEDMKAVYKFDGSEVLVASAPDVVERAKATWDGQTLVILSKRTVPAPGGGSFITDIKQVWSIKNGNLAIEQTLTSEGLSVTGTFVFDRVGS